MKEVDMKSFIVIGIALLSFSSNNVLAETLSNFQSTSNLKVNQPLKINDLNLSVNSNIQVNSNPKSLMCGGIGSDSFFRYSPRHDPPMSVTATLNVTGGVPPYQISDLYNICSQPEPGSLNVVCRMLGGESGGQEVDSKVTSTITVTDANQAYGTAQVQLWCRQ
jgi:hypothetical protein